MGAFQKPSLGFKYAAQLGSSDEPPVRSVSFRDDSEASSTDEEAQRASTVRNKLGRLEGSRCVGALVQSMNVVAGPSPECSEFAQASKLFSHSAGGVCAMHKRSKPISLHVLVAWKRKPVK